MKQLLQISAVGNFGSVGRIAEQIGVAAIENGWKGSIACARNISESRSNIIKIGTQAGVYFNVLWNRIFDCDSPYAKYATKHLIRQIRDDIKPDVIQLHNLHGYYIHFESLFEFLAEYGKPVVWTLHDCWPLTGHCTYFDMPSCDRWKTQNCRICPFRRTYPASYAFSNSKRNFELKQKYYSRLKNFTIVPCSHWLDGLAGQSPILKGINRKVIHNGIDLDIFRPSKDFSATRRKYNIPTGKKIVIAVSNIWNEAKGTSYVFELANALPPDCRLMMVGLPAKLMKPAAKHGIIPIARTENVGELRDLYSMSDVFVNTTLQDNYPSVNMESISCGTPVVTFNSGGSPESVLKGCGCIVEKGNSEQLKNAVIDVLSGDKSSFTEKCVAAAKSNFDSRKVFKEYINMYGRL